MRSFGASLILTTLSTTVWAQSTPVEPTFLFGHDIGIASISADTNFFFVVSDRVSDGCWLNADRALSMAKREFLDAGYTNIVEEYPFGVIVRMSATGYATSEYQCAAYVDFDIGITDTDRRTFDLNEWVIVSEKSSFELGAILTGPKTDMSDRINDTFAGYIDEFIVNIQQEKNRLRQAIYEQSVGDEAKAEFLNSVVRQ
ncbi:hypothetical protein [Yoonia sp. BS5-3]|uniref:DUF4468 domain-containing protein n=1 Tax=Yoonia phaeophyticola TaxID=3137369 RepID=A0ABZ2V9S6_9RHOB